jgi:hypothetical protein
MNSHFEIPLSTRLLAAISIAACLVFAAATGTAHAGTPQAINFTSTAPTGLVYGTTTTYVPTTDAGGASGNPVVLTIASTSSAVCKITTGTVSITGAGTCKISADQAGDVTYDAGHQDQSFTIATAPIVVTAASGTSPYGVAPSIKPSFSGFVNGDTSAKFKTQPTCATDATNASHAGTYPTYCGSAASPNYKFTYVGGSYVVTKAPLVLTPKAKKIKIGKKPKFYFISDGWQGWDDNEINDLSGKPKCTVPSKAKTKAGSYKIKCKIGTLKSANYEITFVTGKLKVGK